MAKTQKKDPAYIHIILTLVILGLLYLLIQVAIFEPQQVLERERKFKEESRLRMLNIKQAEMLYREKYGKFTDNIDSLINFITTDSFIQSKLDSIFKPLLLSGNFSIDSLRFSPKSNQPYILQVDSTVQADSVFTKGGRFLRIDSTLVVGSRYYLECPDGYGSIGDLRNDLKLNVASWGEK